MKLRIVAAACAACTLAACGAKSDQAPSQVAVRVNKEEISVHQVNEQLGRLPGNLAPERRDDAIRGVLNGLIDQNLLVGQALERKLDRDPDVLAALEAARRQVLTQAYVGKVLGAQAKPSEQDIRRYYVENPSLFSERRIFRINELSFAISDEKYAELTELGAKVKNLEDVAAWLRTNRIDFAASSGTRGAEQLPLNAVQRIVAMKPTDVLVTRPPGGRAVAMQVLASVPAPVEEKDAAPLIEQFLANRKRDELTRSEVSRLRDAAKLEYLGDFAKFAVAAAPNGAAAAAAASPTTSSAAAAAPAQGAPVGTEPAANTAGATSTTGTTTGSAATPVGVAGLR